jgi:hypothetical protein
MEDSNILIFGNRMYTYVRTLYIVQCTGPDPDPPDPRFFSFFGLPNPDPLVKGMDPDPALDPDPNPSIIMQK